MNLALAPGLPDAELARRVTEGGHSASAAEAELVRRFRRRVELYGLKHLRDASAATDLAQEVMTMVIEKLRGGAVREPDRIGSFVLGTARMTARDMERGRRRRAELVERARAETSTTTNMSVFFDHERLSQGLGQLTERERAVIVASFYEEKNAAEVAAQFGLSPGNVRIIRHRAVLKLRELMRVDEELGP